MDYTGDITELEKKYNLLPGALSSLVQAESGGNPAAMSPAGAIGLTQLMPGTAKDEGVNPNDPKQNLQGGASYLSKNLDKFGGSYPLAYAAYNAGPGRVAQAGNEIPQIPETQDYVAKTMKPLYANSLNSVGPVTTPGEYSNPGSSLASDMAGSGAGAKVGATTSTATTEPKKSSWKDKILPLVLRIGLPTIAGGILGARDPFRGALASAVTGAASGGLGFLNQNEQNKADANNLQTTQAKLEAQVGEAGAKQKMAEAELANRLAQENYVKGKDASNAERQARQDEFNNNLKRLEYERQLKRDENDNKEKAARVEREKEAKMNPEDKKFKFLSDQLKGQPIDVNNKEQMQALTDNLLAQNAKIKNTTDTTKWYQVGQNNKGEIDPAAVIAHANAYNQYVSRPKAQKQNAAPEASPNSAAPAMPQGAVKKAKDESGQIWWIDANGKAISKAK